MVRGKAQKRYQAFIRDNGGLCYKSFEFIIALTEIVSIRGLGFPTKKDACTAAENIARMLGIEIKWKKGGE